MTRQKAKPQRHFDNPARWWFLTRGGFKEFFGDPVARGYEIMSRHPDFPHLVTKKNDEGISISWEIGDENQPKLTWRELDRNQQDAFYFAHKRNLERMGLSTIAFVGPKAASFNCRDSTESILAGVRYEIRALVKRDAKMLEYFPPNDKDDFNILSDAFATRTPPDKLSWAWAKNDKTEFENHDAVTVEWEGLIGWLKNRRRYGGQPVPYCERHILSALATFLTKNKGFRRHVGNRRGLGRKTFKNRPKFKPEVIAMACVEYDWRLAGRKKDELLPLIQDKLSVLGIKKLRWDNYRNALKKLHDRVSFPKSFRIAETIKRMP